MDNKAFLEPENQTNVYVMAKYVSISALVK